MKYVIKRIYKYHLHEAERNIDLGLDNYHVLNNIKTKYCKIVDGKMTIYKNYSWNGADLIFDTKRNHRASLVHDCLYQLMRTGVIPYSKDMQKLADMIFTLMCAEDGVGKILCKIYGKVLSRFGHKSCDPKYYILEC